MESNRSSWIFSHSSRWKNTHLLNAYIIPPKLKVLKVEKLHSRCRKCLMWGNQRWTTEDKFQTSTTKQQENPPGPHQKKQKSHGIQYRGFLKSWYPTNMGFPTKNDHFGVFWGYHHLRKPPQGREVNNLRSWVAGGAKFPSEETAAGTVCGAKASFMTLGWVTG